MNHDNPDLRTRQSALRVIRLREVLPRTIPGDVLSRQIVRSALGLELVAEAGLLPDTKATALHTEAGGLTAVAVASIRTARAGKLTPHSALRLPHSP